METKILEINLISAQGLKTPSNNLRRVQTYAVAWVNPSAKLRTRVDSLGGPNPTWNDKFLFRVFDDFVFGDTSAVSVEIYAAGYIKDFLIGTVRFLLSTCLKKSTAMDSAIGTPAFTAVQIRRPSGRFQGMLNLAAAVYDSTDFAVMDKVPAMCLRDLVPESPRRWKLSRGGSKRSQQSSGGESCDFSYGSDSTASSALKDFNGARELAGNKNGAKSRASLCGLMMQRRIPFCPSDQNLKFWADCFEEEN